MTNALDNLSELIDRCLPAKGAARVDLAKTLGVSPSTLSRWSARMPGPEVLRALAVALDAPYGVVLAAALRSGGYAETTADILAGHCLTLVARASAAVDTAGSDSTGVKRAASGDVPGAAFTEVHRAAQWAHVQGQLDWRAGYDNNGVVVGEVVIDGAAIQKHVVVYQATWEHRTDAISVDESGVFPDAPSGLDPGSAVVHSLRDTDMVFAVSASELDAGAAQKTVETRCPGFAPSVSSSIPMSPPGCNGPTTSCTASWWAYAIAHRRPERHALMNRRSIPHYLPGSGSSPRHGSGRRSLHNAWGGGRTHDVESSRPWRDPICTYRMEPSASEDSDHA